MRQSIFAVALSTFLFVAMASAQPVTPTAVPNLIRYSGTLKDAQGAAVSSTAAGVTFAIYKQQDGGAPIWMETQTVTPDASGNYSVLLGSTTATGLPADLFSQEEQRWLGVQVQGQAEQPRVLLVSVPYAFKAHEAETLGGKSVSDFVLANGTDSSANAPNSNQASSSAANNVPAVTGQIQKGAASDGPTNFSGSTTDQIVMVTQSGTGAGISAIAGTNAVFGEATGTSGNVYGVQGVATGTGGVALFGNANSPVGGTYGMKGSSTSTSGTGIHALASSTTGSTIGVSALVNSPQGTAAVFNNAGGGNILVGQNNGVAKLTVDGSGDVNASGTFTGDGSGLTGIAFSNLSGTLASSQFSGAYSNAVALSNTSNVYYGNGSNLMGVVGGTGTASYIPIWAASTSLSSSVIYQSSAGKLGIGTTTPAAELDVNGHVNVSDTYNIDESPVVGIGSSSDANLFVGVGAGQNNVAGQGTQNVFSGYNAGNSNTTGQGNVFSGAGAGIGNTSGSWNIFSGLVAGYFNTTGNGNIYIGYEAAFHNTTGNNNLYLGNLGCPYPCTESGTIRIGGDDTLGYGPQTAAYIAGIYGATSSSGIPVYINSNGHLGTMTSSLRFKEQVRDMGDSTAALMKLRPVTFLYKPEYSKGDRTLQYGLIAEEVAKVYPELVAYDNDGQPYTVRYQYLSTMLLNEVQKQYRRAEAQAEVIKTQEQKIDSQQSQIEKMQQRLSRLEALIGTRTSTAQLDPEHHAGAGGAQ